MPPRTILLLKPSKTYKAVRYGRQWYLLGRLFPVKNAICVKKAHTQNIFQNIHL